jgi:hypothetical protein
MSLGVLELAAISGCGKTSDSNAQERVPETSRAEFAIYALSRGRGVPEKTRGVLERARKLLDDAKKRGEVLELKEERIGLEGETRLCVRAKDIEVALELLKKVRAIARGVELFNIVEGPCSKR